MATRHTPFRESTNNTRNYQHNVATAVKKPQVQTPQHYGAISTPKTQEHNTKATTRHSPSIPTPQKNLFSRYLLRTLEADEERPTLTLVLDLDETLVSNRRLDLPAAILRPYVLDALVALRQLPGVEIVLWTASTEETATPVVHQLHARGRIFDDVIFRNDIWFTEPVHSKDLRLLGRDMDRVVVIDNAPQCIKLNKYNGILVDDFTGTISHSDNTMVNIFRVIQAMVNELSNNQTTVSKLLQEHADMETYCKMHKVHMPDTWKHVVNFDGIKPLMIPPHGDFFKIMQTPY